MSTQLVRLQHELENKNGYIGKLEILLRERLTRIDELNRKLEQSRAQIRRLDEECEHWARLVAEASVEHHQAKETSPHV